MRIWIILVLTWALLTLGKNWILRGQCKWTAFQIAVEKSLVVQNHPGGRTSDEVPGCDQEEAREMQRLARNTREIQLLVLMQVEMYRTEHDSPLIPPFY